MRDGQGTHTHRVLPPFSHGDAQKAAAAEEHFYEKSRERERDEKTLMKKR